MIHKNRSLAIGDVNVTQYIADIELFTNGDMPIDYTLKLVDWTET